MRALVMPIPNKVKVGWKTYDVILADPTLNGGDELYGQIDYDRCTITLRAAASPDQQRATLVHELLHAVSNMYGLDLNEKLVTDLANALYCVYKDNSSCTKKDYKTLGESPHGPFAVGSGQPPLTCINQSNMQVNCNL